MPSCPSRNASSQVDTLAFIDDAAAADALLAIAKDRTAPINGDVVWWLIHRSTNDWSKYDVAGKLKSEGILDPDKIVLTAVVSAPAMPADVGHTSRRSAETERRRHSRSHRRAALLHVPQHQRPRHRLRSRPDPVGVRPSPRT